MSCWCWMWHSRVRSVSWVCKGGCNQVISSNVFLWSLPMPPSWLSAALRSTHCMPVPPQGIVRVEATCREPGDLQLSLVNMGNSPVRTSLACIVAPFAAPFAGEAMELGAARSIAVFTASPPRSCAPMSTSTGYSIAEHRSASRQSSGLFYYMYRWTSCSRARPERTYQGGVH